MRLPRRTGAQQITSIRLTRLCSAFLICSMLGLAACGHSATPVAGPEPGSLVPSSPVSTSPGSLQQAVPSASVAAPSPTTAKPSATKTPVVTTPTNCSILPKDNVWHADISHLPVAELSAKYVTSIGLGASVHADFGSGIYDGTEIGIPITTVPAGQSTVHVTFDYADESDKGPYPIPAHPQIEGGGDRHIILYDASTCTDYELYAAQKQGSTWTAGSGAIFDLRSDKLRTAGWTSADAAGLPILPGLVTYAEVASGRIDHAIRMTVPQSQAAFLWPARHQASSSNNVYLPPMGLRLRLKAGVDISHLPTQARIVAQAMKTYGVIVADNGSPWYISGAPDSRWNNDALHALGGLTGSDFEAIDESGLQASSKSGATK